VATEEFALDATNDSTSYCSSKNQFLSRKFVRVKNSLFSSHVYSFKINKLLPTNKIILKSQHSSTRSLSYN